jgi:hypothetical protein
MLSGLGLGRWIAARQRSADPTARGALRHGMSLIEAFVRDYPDREPPASWQDVARAFAELWQDEWVRFDYRAYPGDHEPPPPHAFDEQHLQRCDNIRITAEGWRALAALHTLPDDAAAPSAPRPPDGGVEERDVFISHASEDKDQVARPLAHELIRRGLSVWFDEFELLVGDSLRAEIDRGLAMSRYGVVVLSPSFFAKRWPQAELDGLVAREFAEDHKVVLPVWHNIDHGGVAQHSPMLASRLATSTAAGIDQTADDLQRAARAGRRAPAARRPPTAPVTPPTTTNSGATTHTSDPIDELRERAVHFLAERDEVRMREVLRAERARLEREFQVALQEAHSHGNTSPDLDALRALEQTVREILERRWATLLPVAEHDRGHLDSELVWLAELATLDTGLPQTARREWATSPRWVTWLLLWAVMALAVVRRDFALVRRAWQVPIAEERRTPLPALRLRDTEWFAGMVELARFGKKLSHTPAFHLAFVLADSGLITRRYSEVLRGPTGDAALGALGRIGDTSVVVALLADGSPHDVERWFAGAQVEATLLDALAADDVLRQQVTEGLGLDNPDVVAEIVGTWLTRRVRS